MPQFDSLASEFIYPIDNVISIIFFFISIRYFELYDYLLFLELDVIIIFERHWPVAIYVYVNINVYMHFISIA